MRSIILLIIFYLTSIFTYAQEVKEQNQYYKYNIFSFSGNIKSELVKIKIDNGETIETMKNEKGKNIWFKTPAAAFTYLISLGWELCVNGTIAEGSYAGGTGTTAATSYWIMRKPCTKEEFDKVVNNAIAK